MMGWYVMPSSEKLPKMIRPGYRSSTIKWPVISPAWRFRTAYARPIARFLTNIPPATWPWPQPHPNTPLDPIAVLNGVRHQEDEVPFEEVMHLLENVEYLTSSHPSFHHNQLTTISGKSNPPSDEPYQRQEREWSVRHHYHPLKPSTEIPSTPHNRRRRRAVGTIPVHAGGPRRPRHPYLHAANPHQTETMSSDHGSWIQKTAMRGEATGSSKRKTSSGRSKEVRRTRVPSRATSWTTKSE